MVFSLARWRLAQALIRIARHDTDYAKRYALVFEALHHALRSGLRAGIRIDPAEPAWPVAFIELPTGQVSWHLPQHEAIWDGHDTPTKYLRCAAFVAEYGGDYARTDTTQANADERDHATGGDDAPGDRAPEA